MRFPSLYFFLAAALFLPIYYLIPRKYQWIALLTASWAFLLWSGLPNFLFLLLTCCTSYAAARFLARQRGKTRKARAVLTLCLTVNFSLLALCKLALEAPIPGLSFLSLALPLGISFYLFQSAGYLIDLYRGKAEPEPNFFRFCLFLSYMPQLIQGPISRASRLRPQLLEGRPFDSDQASFGLQRLLWGLFKKLVIADRIAPAVMALRDPRFGGTGFVLLGIFYAVEIYGDFTGGIDMVLGLSQMLGIVLPENFRRPFFSKNIAEYWRRWHITLGEWMKDYVFYPLSVSRPMLKFSRFSRKKWGTFGRRLPVYLASLLTWCVTGIWHGITPNFLLWGILNCLVILISQELTPLYRRFHRRCLWAKGTWYGIFEMLRMFMLMNFIRVCDLFPRVGGYFGGFATLVLRPNLSLLWDGRLLELGLTELDYGILFFSCLLVLTVSILEETGGSVRRRLADIHPIFHYILLFSLFLAVLLLGRYGVGYDPASFIYNQF